MTERSDDLSAEEAKQPPAFGFWLFLVLTVLYLGWRLVQGIAWLFERIF